MDLFWCDSIGAVHSPLSLLHCNVTDCRLDQLESRKLVLLFSLLVIRKLYDLELLVHLGLGYILRFDFLQVPDSPSHFTYDSKNRSKLELLAVVAVVSPELETFAAKVVDAY